MTRKEIKRANMEKLMSFTKNWISTYELQVKTGLTKSCVYTNSYTLIEDGYMETRLVRSDNKHSPPVREYKRLRASLPVDAFDTKAKEREKTEQQSEKVGSLADARYVHKIEQHETKYKAQTQAMRSEYKSPRVYVSGVW